MGRALLLRHGQSVWNAERRWQGLADFGLSALGEAQARAAAERLRGEGITRVVSSPLGRALRTAELMAAELGLDPAEVGIEEDLRERDVGDWSGLTSPEIEERWPGHLDRWRAGQLSSLPGGEGDITGRVVPAVRRIVEQGAPEEVVLVVAHGGVITAVEHALGVEPCRAKNCAGRWVRWAPGRGLVADDAVVLVDPDPAAETTAL